MPKELIVRGKHLRGDVHDIVAVPPVGEDAGLGGEDGAAFLFQKIRDLHF